jgi:hypothetical protein
VHVPVAWRSVAAEPEGTAGKAAADLIVCLNASTEEVEAQIYEADGLGRIDDPTSLARLNYADGG